jgi:hypothetical protein
VCAKAVHGCPKNTCASLALFMFVLQESGMTLITAEDLDDAAEKAVKASAK